MWIFLSAWGLISASTWFALTRLWHCEPWSSCIKLPPNPAGLLYCLVGRERIVQTLAYFGRISLSNIDPLSDCKTCVVVFWGILWRKPAAGEIHHDHHNWHHAGSQALKWRLACSRLHCVCGINASNEFPSDTHHDTLPKLTFCSPCARCQVLIITRPGALGLRTLPTLLVEQNILFLWESICGVQTDNNTVSFLRTTLPVVKESHRTCSTYRRPHMSFSICLVGWLVGYFRGHHPFL